MVRIAATPEQLTDLKAAFNARADQVDDLVNDINRRIGSVDWEGPAHDRFVTNWNGQFVPALRNLSQSLRDAGAEADRVGQNIRVAGGG